MERTGETLGDPRARRNKLGGSDFSDPLLIVTQADHKSIPTVVWFGTCLLDQQIDWGAPHSQSWSMEASSPVPSPQASTCVGDVPLTRVKLHDTLIASDNCTVMAAAMRTPCPQSLEQLSALSPCAPPAGT
jgi:hypothetical protein